MLKFGKSTCDWPFLIIVIGFPSLPSVLQGLSTFLFSSDCFAVEPNLIEFPNLPSIITSPSFGNRFLIFAFYSKVFPGLGSTI